MAKSARISKKDALNAAIEIAKYAAQYNHPDVAGTLKSVYETIMTIAEDGKKAQPS
jgi:hypothetical protein